MGDLVGWAETQSRTLLSRLGDRWLHVQGVTAKAEAIAGHFDGDDREHLVAAAHLHDVGYAPSLRRSGAHQLDGAEYVRAFGHERLAGLIAHHSAARFELELRGLGDRLDQFPSEASDVTAALIYCDLTTGPTGQTVSLEERIADVAGRYGTGSLVVTALRQAHTVLAEAVCRTALLVSDCG
jgi:hypothetical protein